MSRGTTQPTWHLLQVSDVLDLEFASALSESVPVVAWKPVRSFNPWRTGPGRELELSVHERYPDIPPNPNLRARELPLLRGFARFPLSLLARTGPTATERLRRQTEDASRSPLICTVPYFASVAERWPGPVIYWLTDLIAEYTGASRSQVERLDRRMCRRANLVCPNSERLAHYLTSHADCDPAKIQVVPNATRASNVLEHPLFTPAVRPTAIAGIDTPIAGVIGNQAGNMDWLLLQQTVARTPWLSWVFVGPTSMAIPDPAQSRARAGLMNHPRAHFVGRQPYGQLASWARTFDAAVLPYKRCEPTYSGSSTRFYEHLAACRPMIATRGLEELTRKTPLLALVDTADQAVQALERLRAQNFEDGHTAARWRASLSGTWQARAHTVQSALTERLNSAAMHSSSLASREPLQRLASR